jgi:hypothetical protein
MNELRRLFDQFWTNELDQLVADANRHAAFPLPNPKEQS